MKLFLTLFVMVMALLCPNLSRAAVSAEIHGPDVRVDDNRLYVSATLSLGEKTLQELRSGLTKELRIYVDLFRVWEMWPDEFVAGKFFIRTLKCDPVKMSFVASSSDGNTIVHKRFRSFESMLQWALNINDVRISNIRDIERGTYFVRVSAESKIRKLPPVIGYFMIFLPENEFRIRKDSGFFSLGTGR